MEGRKVELGDPGIVGVVKVQPHESTKKEYEV
jgi:hypothetical protein